MGYHLTWALFFVRICWHFCGSEAWEFQPSQLTLIREGKVLKSHKNIRGILNFPNNYHIPNDKTAIVNDFSIIHHEYGFSYWWGIMVREEYFHVLFTLIVTYFLMSILLYSHVTSYVLSPPYICIILLRRGWKNTCNIIQTISCS